MQHPFSQTYVARAGAPKLERFDDAIFSRRYFAACMACGFCADRCCQHGVDLDAENVARILEDAPELEARTGIPRERWFEPGFRSDPDFPGGRITRTRVEGGACVFLNRGARGCILHARGLEIGGDSHRLKPLVSALFPLTFEAGLLHASTETGDGTLVCLGEGLSLYRGAREELGHHFGPGLLAELDAFEAALK